MRWFKPLDYAVFLLFLVVVAFSVVFASGRREGVLTVEVEASGVLHVMPLYEEGELELTGPVGKTVVRVADGEVSIIESDCRDKICIAMGPVSKDSGWIACLPNRVFVRVTAVDGESADDGTGVDAGAF